MAQHRNDSRVPNPGSKNEKAEGSRQRSVLDDRETFEHGSGTSEVAKTMGSRGHEARQKPKGADATGGRGKRETARSKGA